TYAVTASGYTTGTGLTYRWQYSDTGGAPWTNQGAATNTYASLTGMIAPALGVVRTWQLVVTCTDSGGSANSSTNTFTSVIAYCTPSITSTVEPITYVNFAGIVNTSSNLTSSPDYEDFTGTTPGTVMPGTSYPITLKGNTNGSFTNYFTVFIDWNQDGNLLDANETYEIGFISGSTGTDLIELSGAITVPPGALSGSTRMRVLKNFYTSPTAPCGSYSYGQAEDYTIQVTPLNCLANPQELTAITTTTTTATISWTHASPLPGNGYEYIISLDNTTSTPTGDITATTTANTTTVNLT